MEGSQDHGVDDAQTQGHDLVAEDVGPAIEGRILGYTHLQERAASDENHGDQDGQERCEGTGEVFALDQDVIHVGG